jgi:hypothetical protein
MTEVGAELPIRPRARMTQLAPFRPLPLDSRQWWDAMASSHLEAHLVDFRLRTLLPVWPSDGLVGENELNGSISRDSW